MAVVSRSQFLVPADAGEELRGGPLGIVVKISTETTGGILSACEMSLAPGFMVPPHMHLDTDEWSYVLEGRIGARIGADEFVAEPGAFILKPRNIPHAYWNPGPEPARIIELLAPGSFEGFFRETTALARAGELTDEALGRVAQKYATLPETSWIEELTGRGLKITP